MDENKAWRIDYERKIIYINQMIRDVDIVRFINEISENEKGLRDGPGKTWTIITEVKI